MKNVTNQPDASVIQVEGAGKVCFRCREWKSYFDAAGEPNFVRSAERKDGFTNLCRACKATYNRASYIDHREQHIERVMNWQKANIERHRARQRKAAQEKRQERLEERIREMQKDGLPVKPW